MADERGYQPGDSAKVAAVMAEATRLTPPPSANGCICQVCADRGGECSGVADTEWDEQCRACLDGHHIVNETGRVMRRFTGEQPTAYPRGRWFGDADDYEDPFR